MKKLMAAVLAVLLVLSFAACNKKTGETEESGSSDSMSVVYDAPEGYEKLSSGGLNAEYVAYDANDEVTHRIGIVITELTEEERTALQGNDLQALGDALGADFEDIDGVMDITFLTVGGYPGVRIDDLEDGKVMDITYFLVVGDWRVTAMSYMTPDTLEEVHEDILTLIDSIRLEQFTFHD